MRRESTSIRNTDDLFLLPFEFPHVVVCLTFSCKIPDIHQFHSPISFKSQTLQTQKINHFLFFRLYRTHVNQIYHNLMMTVI